MIHTSACERTDDVPEQVLDDSEVVTCRGFHEPTQVPDDEQDVLSGMSEVSEALITLR